MTALAALLHGAEGFGHLLRRFDALRGDHSQLGYRIAIAVDGLGKAFGISPDRRQSSVLLLGFPRFGEMRPGRFDGGSQGLGMGGEGVAIEGQAITQHAAHRLAVTEKVLEGRLTLAFRRVGVGLVSAADQGQAEGGQQQNFGVWNSKHRDIPLEH